MQPPHMAARRPAATKTLPVASTRVGASQVLELQPTHINFIATRFQARRCCAGMPRAFCCVYFVLCNASVAVAEDDSV